ncbi:MAG: hypothetical protein H7039_03335 [Bryobacteraceae bacterium]|nr:hypothetical protein [Bryobacteraceae bacterium]
MRVPVFREAATLEQTYIVWVAVLVLLYPVCLGYRGFKMATPRDSFWRLF